jgi:hypothetical protein
MMLKQKRRRHILFTEEVRVLQALHDIRERLNSVEAWDYMDRYIQLKGKAMQLQKKGLKVRIVLPDFPRRPMLVIGK